jgi:hypothetical protein
MIVARRPDMSCRIWRRSAEVGEAAASPTPTPVYEIFVTVFGWKIKGEWYPVGRLLRIVVRLWSLKRLGLSPGVVR